MKPILKTVVFILLSNVIFHQEALAQDSTKADVKDMLNSKKFTFVAQTVSPMRSGMRQLTSYYDLKISGDSLISNLPYFGRAYSAPINPSDAGLNFTSTNFEYTVTAGKKDGWNVLIKPKDKTDIQQLFFTIFDNRHATLNVTGINKDAISFNGYITKKRS